MREVSGDFWLTLVQRAGQLANTQLSLTGNEQHGTNTSVVSQAFENSGRCQMVSHIVFSVFVFDQDEHLDALMIDVHGVPSYPMGAYPADMTYPPDGDYPVTGVYGDSDDADDVGTSAPLKQLVVPGLIPSHLQRRKSRTKVVPKRKPPPGTVKEASKSVANDYDKFMEEISGLT